MRNLLIPLRVAGVAVVYVLLARLALAFFSIDGIVGVFWPASGWAMAVLLMGGRRYGWGILAGAVTTEVLLGIPVQFALVVASGVTMAALLGHALLVQEPKFDTRLIKLEDYARLIWRCAIPASVSSAVIGVGCMTYFGALPRGNFGMNMVHWAMGDGLGILLVAPLALIWRHWPKFKLSTLQWLEALLVACLIVLAGGAIFLGWLVDVLPAFPRKGYWLFILFGWAAARMHGHGVIALLCLVCVQAIYGMQRIDGYFSGPQIEVRLIDGWFFLMALATWSMAAAIYFRERKQSERDLQIAASAFNCQEGMIVTDAEHTILRVNQSFTRIVGYTPEEVIGRNADLMCSDRHPTSFYASLWEQARTTGTSTAEVWHRRKNGEVFPQWLTITAVRNSQGHIINYVLTHMDISERLALEVKRKEFEAAHRDALVREVHHRIKNNLQGISGLLREFAHEHPETADILNKVTSQVRTIAVIHGLQGRRSLSTVRVCELTSAIASAVQTVWHTPISVDIPDPWTPSVVAEMEAVPIALVLNELMVNAVKHGGKANGRVDITLRKGIQIDAIEVSIRNIGNLHGTSNVSHDFKAGLNLVHSLIPPAGAVLTQVQQGPVVVTSLELMPPVIRLESGEQYVSLPLTPQAFVAG